MEAKKIYKKLEEDFIYSSLSDDWFTDMGPVADFLSDNFKRRSMGLVCDNAQEIEKVYTAVFPSDKIMRAVLDKGDRDVLLFVHHPQIWDIRKAPNVFQQMNKMLLQQFKERRISIYNLHTPLDNFGEYSTSATLAGALNVEIEKKFAPYNGGLCGVFGRVKISTTQGLKERIESAVGHKASLYQYGDEKIRNGMVAVVAGGGNSVDILKEVAKEGINVFITGITAENDHSIDSHNFAKNNKINILGGTHYSTEKFSCIAMCEYFKKIGLYSEFISDKPVLEDL